jgi:hypothetical protein
MLGYMVDSKIVTGDAELILVPMHNYVIPSAKIGDRIIIPLERIRNAIGLTDPRFVSRIRDDERFETFDAALRDEQGRLRVMACTTLEDLPNILFTINPSRVGKDRPQIRTALIAFQKESAKALRDYWFEGAAINPRAQRAEARRQIERLAGIEVRKSFTDHLKEVYERSETSATLSQWCINFTKMMTKKALMIDEAEFQRRKAQAGGNFRESCDEAELRRIRGAEMYVGGLVAMTEYGQIKTLYYDADEHMGLLAKIDRKQIA